MTRDALVEKIARALCEERTWIGAWEKANDQERNAWRRDARAAIASLAASGFAVVPAEATPKMLAAGWSVLEQGRTTRPFLGPGAGLAEVYPAMIAAAQEESHE